MYAVEMRGITKRFPGMIANDQIEFLVEKGEIHSLLGENGAGKTTLMKILFGLYQPDGGSIKINGNEIKHQTAVKAFEMGLGMVHQHFMLIDNMTVWENIVLGSEPGNFMIDRKKGKEIVKHLSEKYHFDLDVDAKISEISVGMKQRVEILKTLYRGAEIIILDEPTAGLDPKERAYFRNIIAEMSKDKIIIISTHIVSDIEYISDQVLIMKKGKFILQGPADELLKEVKNEVWSCRVPNNQWSNFERTHCIANSHVMKEVIEARVISTSSPIEGAIIVEPTLEDLYLKLFSDELQEG